ncbi:hypothetical protein BX666DRAFT_1896169 [Dichotomocladium elegans]|nr:hypothetical protein BX666DRAFT_1896169 [Dichotomocladium elegans]
MPLKNHKSFRTIAYEKLFQYELLTAVYVMEPWEKTVFNIIVIIILALSLTTLYQYSLLIMSKLASWVI